MLTRKEKREQKIEDLLTKLSTEDRANVKPLLDQWFLPFTSYVEEKYSKLEARAFEERTTQDHRYDIVTALFEKDMIGFSDQFTPISIKENGIGSVVILKDKRKIDELIQSDRKFRAVIKTSEDQYKAVVKVVCNTSFQEELKKLYPLFCKNGVDYKSVYAPFLYKWFDCVIDKSDCPEDEIMEGIAIDFEEYEDSIIRNPIPAWNIKKQQIKSSDYPIPCKDQVLYEHVIYKEYLNDESEYLIDTKQVPALSVKRKNGDLFIRCYESEPIEWTCYEFKAVPHDIDIPVFHNEDVDGIRMVDISKGVRTMADLKNQIRSFGYSDQLMLGRIYIEEGMVQGDEVKIEPWVSEESLIYQSADTLVLEFHPSNWDSPYNYDLLSYLVARVQFSFEEYNCIGRLV